MLAALHTTLLCSVGVSAFTMGNVRMQTTVKHYCNPDLLDEHGKPVQCHISNSVETMGLVLPGMDDGKSFTMRQDVLVAKDGQVVVQASPNHPYQYLVFAETESHSQTLQLFNKKSYPVHHQTHEQQESSVRRLDVGHTLEDDGWTHQGLVQVDGQKLNKWVRSGVQGVDQKTGVNMTALSQTGLMPNSWTLFTDEADKKMVKLLSTNVFENDRVYQETVVTHWEELHDDLTVDDALQHVFSAYEIEEHSASSPTADEAPIQEARLSRTHLVGEDARLFFNDGETPDWKSQRRLRRADGTASPIDYFKLEEGSAAHKFFLSQYHRHLIDLVKFEFPHDCKLAKASSNTPYCLYVDVDVNRTALDLQFAMSFVDVHNSADVAQLKISVTAEWPGAEVVLDFSFVGGGCAIVFQKGIAFANLNIKVCLSANASGDHLLQPDKRTYQGAADITVSFNIKLPVVPALSISLHGGVAVWGAPHSNISAYGVLGIDVSLAVVGAGVSVDIYGNTVNQQANVWDFQSHVNVHVWVNILVYKHNWPWTWTIWKAGPVTF
ncbi:hypothetical protein FOL47_000281 [Perkinsus chesapeaki]|uniref:Uncharacterized protein n=1 Tax=Perkinsus chesapeaki TaxID=330153 RepID=A0A7J6KYG2_PERCH|nr:hypothetical protein FOL47_000281 [Perkinsus chesapeaki]